MSFEHPYKDYDTDVYPVPVINYEGDNFWFRGLGGGYYLWNDATDKLSITAYWSPLYFKAKDSGDHQMRHLDDRKSTMMAVCLMLTLPSTVTCVPPWLAIPWITATASSGIWPGCIVTPTVA